MNATSDNKLTPEQALNILTELASLTSLKLNLAEHQAVQQSLAVLRPLVTPQELPVPDAKNPTE